MKVWLQQGGRLLQRWLHQVLEPAANPRQGLVDAVAEQRQLLALVQEARTRLRRVKTQMDSQSVAGQQRLHQLQEQARTALQHNREDLARLCLQRRQALLHEWQIWQAHGQEAEQEDQKLALLEQRLLSQIEAGYACQQVLAARYSAAEAQVRIQEALTGVAADKGEFDWALQQVAEKTAYLQARSTALEQLAEVAPWLGSGDAVAPIETSPLLSLNDEQAIEEQLNRLKHA